MSKIFLVIIIFNIFLFFLIKRPKILNLILDKPDNYRKIHVKNASSIGGFIFILNLILLFILNETSQNFYNLKPIYNSVELNVFFFISLVLIFTLGVFDDVKNISYKKKFLITIFIIFILLLLDDTFIINKIHFSFYSNIIILNKLSIPLTILCILLFINAFNMFDGINLQAALYTFLLFIYLIFNNVFTNLIIFMLIPLIIFISQNYNGKIFLGNNGSLLLSFFLSLIFIKGYNLGLLKYTDQIVITMLIPGLDMFRLFIMRILNKKNPFKPDKNHIHHIIHNFTKSSNKTVLITIFFCVMPQILFYFGITNLIIIIICSLIYFISIFYFIKFTIKNH